MTQRFSILRALFSGVGRPALKEEEEVAVAIAAAVFMIFLEKVFE